ncbi:hypothetical protein Q8A67_019040 [Cirrhinus molitorella]|uniref:Uncharacterized protein n=1 Tax=Cirrhinus molitorella TaxID=172907 RepID=A0AA88P6H0_9TELE|nr:hypothetical protein Q8A67_019040 [Cirrhinus molitorella]
MLTVYCFTDNTSTCLSDGTAFPRISEESVFGRILSDVRTDADAPDDGFLCLRSTDCPLEGLLLLVGSSMELYSPLATDQGSSISGTVMKSVFIVKSWRTRHTRGSSHRSGAA